ncbi:hypothetical protein ACQJBY_021096 [Aegilops geniculata]
MRFVLLPRSTQNLNSPANDNSSPAGRPAGRHSPDGTAARPIWSRQTPHYHHRRRHRLANVLFIDGNLATTAALALARLTEFLREGRRSPLIGSMSGDWGPVLIATAFFVVMLPGLICEIPGGGGRGRPEFHSMKTNGIAMFVHTVIFFAFCAIFMVAVGVHVYAG